MRQSPSHADADADADAERSGGSNVVETMQSLIVAFVVAMTFRAFVTEGFVIPTGSMAPTLLGQHLDFRAPETGWPYAVGFDASAGPSQDLPRRIAELSDPLMGPNRTERGTGALRRIHPRAGDRILINKLYYAFREPKRFDVVVFKNPTNPNGADGNFIKRLVGLPNESLWLLDGDVFSAPLEAADDFDQYVVRRKPDHVQAAVWQPVFRSLHLPDDLDADPRRNPLAGDGWAFAEGTYVHDGDGLAILEWSKDARRMLNDWHPYNQLSRTADAGDRPVGDLRIAGTVTPGADGQAVTIELEVRGTQYRWELGGGVARVRMRPEAMADLGPDAGWSGPAPVETPELVAGRPVRIECWHADQRLVLRLGGRTVLEHVYDWRPRERLERTTGRAAGGDDAESLGALAARRPQSMALIRWRFEGGPVELDRVEVDRDIHYAPYDPGKLPFSLRSNPPRPDLGELRASHGYGCHPTTPARMGPDQFYMLGDNTLASSDSRAWGSPHPIVAEQVDPSAFVVHRSLLLGKAWVVYFPALHPLNEGGRGFIPNFGDLRFIR